MGKTQEKIFNSLLDRVREIIKGLSGRDEKLRAICQLLIECKCYETSIDSPKLQAFWGKYMARWFKDRRSQALFIALPGINSHAKGFYKENIETNSEITFTILEEDDVLEKLFKSTEIAQPEIIAKNIPADIGSPGDWSLIYTDKGIFWFQYIIPIGGGIGSVLRSIKLLFEAGSNLSTSNFRQRTNLSEKSLYNVLRDMRLLGLIKVDNDNIALLIDLPKETEAFEEALRNHLQERLKRNRLIWHILKTLEDREKLTITEISQLLENSCPYISATKKTWQTYARNFARWMDYADLAIFSRDGILYKLQETEIRDRRPFLFRKRSGITVPPIQFTPIERVAIRLVKALRQKGRVNWSGFRSSTITKSLMALEELGFIRRKPNSIILGDVIEDFADHPEKRPEIFAKAALNIRSFAIFIDILQEYKDKRLSLGELGMKLKEKLGTDWKEGTAKTNAKIMLDWARHAHLAPEIWSYKWRRKSIIAQPTLFPDFEKE